jgi:beta-glucanase (GH16 family)
MKDTDNRRTLTMLTTRLLLLLAVLLAAPAAPAADWQLVWSDEFDKPGLPDPTKWMYEEGFVRNNEAQFYTRARKENARVEDGNLVIESRREQFANPAYQPGSPQKSRRGKQFADYTSASVTTRDKASWTYGRIEVRAKVPGGRGTWPAIWMLGMKGGWPRCGEIDIMEHVGHDPERIHANLHTAAFNHTKGNGRGNNVVVADATTAFHVYAAEWYPDRIDVFVDDQKYLTVKKEPGHGEAEWPFDQPHYLLLNLAIGGAWGGQKGIDDTIFPTKYLIDYVRVYQDGASRKTEVAK